ncbi:uncharacterized protein [Oscarella lobularis]|uniref:uncharacterized protein isoform X1 n=1 Tax=Oscarella lobularis TaxID=121494 RepID=UPI00331350B2
MRQWLAFLKSERKSIVSDIPIVVVGNKRTGDNPDNSIDPLGAFRIYIAQLVKEFTGIFRLAGVVEMDCKKGQSQAMNLFRCELKRIKDCRSLILNYFIGDNRFLKLEEFRSIVEHRLRRPLIRDLPIKLLAQNLHDSGTILYFRTLEQIYLQPSLLVTNLLGPILSDPDEFYISAVDDDTGQVNRDHIGVALELFQEKQWERDLPCASFTADEAIRVMLDLDLICQIEGKDGPHSYHVPCLIKESKPARVWEKRDDMVVYRGRRYRVSHPKTDAIPPSLFPVLQSRCAAISGYRMILWKDGFKLEVSGESHFVECLVEITSENDAVDVIVRCSKGGELVAKNTLEDIKRTVESVRSDKANGTPMEWCYLGSDNLESHSSEVAVYDRADVKSCKSNTAIVKARKARDATYPHIRINRLRFPHRIRDGDLKHGGRFPPEDSVVTEDLIAAISSGASSKWEEICCVLLSAEVMMEIRRENHSNKVSLQLALEKWKAKTEDPLVKKVLLACTESSVSKRIIEGRYKKVTSLLL